MHASKHAVVVVVGSNTSDAVGVLEMDGMMQCTKECLSECEE